MIDYIPDFFFAISFGVALFFLLRSVKDGYWGPDSEEIKHEMLRED
jgi:hypothetical protein